MADLHVLQMSSGPNIDTNLTFVESAVSQLPNKHPNLVLLPECFACFDAPKQTMFDSAKPAIVEKICERLSVLCKRYGTWIVAGSMAIESQSCSKYHAASLVFNDQGECVSRYNKIHLFDADVADSTQQYRESDTNLAGEEVVVFDSPWGRIGQSICYDLRFPELYQQMAQPDIILVPSAFTEATGQAHWHALIRARSIENQCFVMAANQVSSDDVSRKTYGNSCIYSPWGELLASKNTTTGLASACFDSTRIRAVRAKMPLDQHKQNRTAF